MFFSNRSQTQPYRQLPLRIRQRRRLIEKTEHRDGFRQKTTYFHWNGNNQLESLTNAQGEVWYYKYDALGRRIEKACPERQSMTRYVWDGDQIAYQSTEKQGKLDSHRHSVFNGWELIAQQDGYFKHDLRTNEKTWTEETHYAVSQPNGQPLALFNPQGKRTWRKQPTSLWGLPLLNRWERKQSEPINPNLLFAGQYLDDESGLAYNRFRYYDPESGNYLTSDPIGLQGGETPYGYVHNPMGWVDPFGLAGCKKPGGYKNGDVDLHGVLSPQVNRAPGHLNTAADNFIQSHHPIQDAWAKRNINGYQRNAAPATLLPSASGMSHAQISNLQRIRRTAPNGWNTSLRQEFNIGYREMINAGVPKAQAQKAFKDAYKYFDGLRSQNLNNPFFDI